MIVTAIVRSILILETNKQVAGAFVGPTWQNGGSKCLIGIVNNTEKFETNETLLNLCCPIGHTKNRIKFRFNILQ